MSATVSRPVAGGWLAILLRGGPHQVVGPVGRPYLLRWFLLLHNRIPNVDLQSSLRLMTRRRFTTTLVLCAARTAVSPPHRAARGPARSPRSVSHAGGDRSQGAPVGILVRR
jgi:hypothetical protein